MNKEALFLINPVSGGRAGNRCAASLEGLLRDLGLRDSCDIAETSADGLNADKNLSSYSRVIAAGGDGTVARIVQKLAALEKKPLLGIIPLGTGNDLARVAGCYRLFKRKGLRALVRGLLAGTERPLDVFSVNDQLFFTNYCGIGLDAKISNDYNLKRHAPLVRAAASLAGGRAAYFWFTAINLGYRMPFALELTAAGNKPRVLQLGAGARQVIVTSIPSYAAGARASMHSVIGDGLFEVTVVETLRQWLLLHLTRLAPATLPRLLLSTIMQFQTAELALRFSGSTCFQADGELYPGFAAGGQGLKIKRAAQVSLVCV